MFTFLGQVWDFLKPIFGLVVILAVVFAVVEAVHETLGDWFGD